MRLGIDLDGVCFPFEESLIRYMKHMGLDKKYQIGSVDSWHFYREWGMSDDEFVQLCNDGVDAGFVFSGGYIDDAPAQIRRMKRMGHSIHIVTNRSFGRTPISSSIATANWLFDNDIPYDTIDFTADKTSVKTDMFIEDNLNNYDALEAAGTVAFLVDRPWNHREDNRLRVKNIEEFADIVEVFTLHFESRLTDSPN